MNGVTETSGKTLAGENIYLVRFLREKMPILQDSCKIIQFGKRVSQDSYKILQDRREMQDSYKIGIFSCKNCSSGV